MTRPMLFGVPVDPLTFDESVQRIVHLVEARAFTQHVVLNASKVVLMHDDTALREVIAGCALSNADGQSVVWAGRLLGVRFPERVTGIDLMGAVIAECESRQWPVYFLGATSQVLAKFIAEVKRRHPAIKIAGSRDGYFDEDSAVAERIAQSGARVLLVAMPSPRKEMFLSEQADRLGGVFAMGVGGSFDVWAGVTRRAPKWMRTAGLEWFYRFAQEPRRMWRRYMIGNIRFLLIVLSHLITGVSSRAGGVR